MSWRQVDCSTSDRVHDQRPELVIASGFTDMEAGEWLREWADPQTEQPVVKDVRHGETCEHYLWEAT